MSYKPLVTVVIPVYNYGHKVGRTIESVMEQTINNLECIIVDDGSVDNTREKVLEKIKNDRRFHYFHQDNAGVSVARNKGISLGSAPYVCCVDSDDAIAPLFLEACVKSLASDPSLGIAYTGMLSIKPDGSEGLSPWPPDYNYDQQLKGQNQIPTCCVFRKVMWERLGGYKRRYAPDGAGEEDAEFWLRAGAYGWNARKVTDAGLFIYSWLSGRVSGNRQHQSTDWTAWHPWVKDGQHPFASMASPKNGQSHPVRQYDSPQISVIIPVAHSHIRELENALDSLEAQTFRRWEAIVVFDGDPASQEFAQAMRPYPYARVVMTGGNLGAGAARNRGAINARASLLLFLDADDWLYPQALEVMLLAYGEHQGIIYSDYVGKAYMDYADALKVRERLLYYDEKHQEAVIRHYSADYDRARALQQPDPASPYIWNLICSLVPAEWHQQIGGFDENMPSWEDWDYWLRMARAGKCFCRVKQDLVVYRFYTGGRRERGLQDHQRLIQYLQAKYADQTDLQDVDMGCGCNQGASVQQYARTPQERMAQQEQRIAAMQDSDLVLCEYRHPNRGNHIVIGHATGRKYGYRGGGQKFLVDRRDIAAQPDIYFPIVMSQAAQAAPQSAPPPPPAPVNQNVVVDQPKPKPVVAEKETEDGQEEEKERLLVAEEEPQEGPYDLQTIPGVTATTAALLNADGVHTPQQIYDLGLKGLLSYKGVGENRARAIRAYIKDNLLAKKE